MATSRARPQAMPPTVSSRPMITAMASEVCTASWASRWSLAPRNCDTTTPAPTARPWLKPMSR